MNRFFLSLSIMVISSASIAQKQYFIYLQSDPEQIFFLKVNEKIHNSTLSGYLILSRLRDTIYNFSVGFPQNKWPEQKFTIDMRGRDHGYLLKNFGEKGWGLFDLQTSAIQMSPTNSSGSSQRTEQREVSAFTDILSKAANDPSLKEKPVSLPVAVKENVETGNGKPAKKTEEPTFVKKEEIPVVKNDDPPASNKESITIKTEEEKPMVEEYKKSVVTKRSESSTSEGLGLTYIDDYGNGKKDTINIFIPNPRMGLAEIKQPVKEEKQFLELSNTDNVKKTEPVEKKTEKPPNVIVSKHGCPGVATEADFLRIRKKMAAETNDDAMLGAAKKYFKTKCFTTAQIKNLSTLYLNDNGKYKFFDAAYTYITDPDNFPSLQAELKDEYYVNRFKAMLR